MRRALLIGAETNGLVGVANDLARMNEALGLHGFACRSVMGAAATRDEILAALRQLIAETVAGDAVLVYYTGHGGLVANRTRTDVVLDGGTSRAPPEPRYFQYIVPTDHSQSEFRGIFSAELTAIIAELTAVTANVTVVLDCCHATGQVLHGGRLYRCRAIPRPWAGNAEAYAAWLRAQGYDLTLHAAHVEGNPRAVCLAACSPEEWAYEYEDTTENGDRGGLLTVAFIEALRGSVGGDPPLWEAIEAQIRERVRAEMPGQNPVVQGPRHRRLFAVEEAEVPDAFATFGGPDGLRLRGGSLHGLRSGDRFLVMPANIAVPDRELALAELEAELVGEHVTTVKEVAFDGRPPVRPGVLAIRVATTYRRLAVRLAGAVVPAIAKAIAASPRLTLVEDGAFASVYFESTDRLAVLEEDGTPIRWISTVESDRGARDVVRVLEQLARVRALLDLHDGEDEARLVPPNAVWARVHPGALKSTEAAAEGSHPGVGLELLHAEGAALGPGDQIVVIVGNTGTRTVYVSILGVGVDRSITLLSASEPRGVRLAVGERYTLGQDRAGQLLGVPIAWPAVVPASIQPYRIVVVATHVSVDLRSLEADIHDVGELLARVGERPVFLASSPGPLTPPVCRVAVLHLSARVIPEPV